MIYWIMGSGIVVFVIGIVVSKFENIDEQKQVEGKIVAHKQEKDIPYCQIEYNVNNKTYSIWNSYRSVHHVSYLMARKLFQNSETILLKDWDLYLLDGTTYDLDAFCSSNFPLSSKINVYYFERHPENGSVFPIKKDKISTILIWIACLIIVVSEYIHMIL